MQAKQTLAEQLAVQDFHNELQLTFSSNGAHNDPNTPVNGALKYDQGKPDFTYISVEMLTAIARVREFGSKKYNRNNWKKGFKISRSLAACLRHIYAHLSGETYDKESSQPHLWHAACSLEHAIYDLANRPENDDR